MKYQIDHDIHIHSCLSTCSRDPEQNTEAILDYAKRNKLHTVCLTDHFWDRTVPGASDWYAPQDYDHVTQSKPLPQAEGHTFLFGCETEFRADYVLGTPVPRMDDFSFVIIPTTHMHSEFALAPEDADSNEHRAAAWVRRLDRVLDMDLPFHKIGIAHLACPLINRKGHLEVLDLIPTQELERVFTKAAARGCGIELNAMDFGFSDENAERVLRIFRVAKKCGCKFYLGSDAHHPRDLESAIPNFQRAIDLLELTEDDKFALPKQMV